MSEIVGWLFGSRTSLFYFQSIIIVHPCLLFVIVHWSKGLSFNTQASASICASFWKVITLTFCSLRPRQTAECDGRRLELLEELVCCYCPNFWRTGKSFEQQMMSCSGLFVCALPCVRACKKHFSPARAPPPVLHLLRSSSHSLPDSSTW